MIAPSARTVVIAAAAAAITGTAALGQQLAATDIASDRQAYIESHCGPLARAELECVTKRSIEFTREQTAAVEKRIEAGKQTLAAQDKTLAAQGKTLASQADVLRCIDFLKQKRAGGTVFDRTITRDNACPYARELGLN